MIATGCLLLAAGAGEANAQIVSRNGVYLEIHSSARDYGINYERRLGAHITLRSGLMMSSEPSTEGIDGGLGVTAIPVMVNLIDGIHRLGEHRLELGVGAFVRVVDGRQEADGSSDAGKGGVAAAVGYRYQPLGSGLLVRAGVPMLFSRHLVHGGFQLSLGYAF